MEETQFRLFEARLATPPADAAADAMSVDDEGQAFLAFASAVGGDG